MTIVSLHKVKLKRAGDRVKLQTLKRLNAEGGELNLARADLRAQRKRSKRLSSTSAVRA